MSDKELTADELTAQMDAQVALNRETNHRAGGNTVEPGQYETGEAPEPVAAPEPMSNDDNAAAVAAMDAQVAAANGGVTVSMTTGVTTTAPATPEKPKAPARAKNKK